MNKLGNKTNISCYIYAPSQTPLQAFMLGQRMIAVVRSKVQTQQLPSLPTTMVAGM